MAPPPHCQAPLPLSGYHCRAGSHGPQPDPSGIICHLAAHFSPLQGSTFDLASATGLLCACTSPGPQGHLPPAACPPYSHQRVPLSAHSHQGSHLPQKQKLNSSLEDKHRPSCPLPASLLSSPRSLCSSHTGFLQYLQHIRLGPASGPLHVLCTRS